MDSLSASPRFAGRIDRLTSSPIRDILSVLERPGMISFAGGLPAEDALPDLPLDSVPRSALQYGPSEGETPLREATAEHLAGLGLSVAPEQVLVLSGSQQGIDLVAKLFIEEGTPVLVEDPTYLAALQVFSLFGAAYQPVDVTDRFALERVLVAARPVLGYLIPTFQNPTGRCLTRPEREAVAAAFDDAGTVLFEDDPYRELAFEGVDRTPIAPLLRKSSWVYQGSFSKTLAPGLRLGYLAASPDLITPLVRLKQAADLHSSRVSQHLALAALGDAGREDRLLALRRHYTGLRDAFHEALTLHLGDLATWSAPAGGMFFWLTLATPVDTRTLLGPAIERGVAFMPGEPFFAGEVGGRGVFRLNFSNAKPDEVHTGLRALREVLLEALP